jgi:hypothetical protein
MEEVLTSITTQEEEEEEEDDDDDDDNNNNNNSILVSLSELNTVWYFDLPRPVLFLSKEVFVLEHCIASISVKGLGLRPLACWDCGFDFRRGQGCLSVVSAVCCHVEISSMG